MFPRDRFVARPGGRRWPAASSTARHPAFATGALVAFLLVMLPGSSAGESSVSSGCRPEPAALELTVSESGDAVHLRIQATGDIEPGSVEVRFSGSKVIVLARDTRGRTIRSQRVRLPAPVVEDGVTADYDDEDALVMTLRKQNDARATTPLNAPEALAR